MYKTYCISIYSPVLKSFCSLDAFWRHCARNVNCLFYFKIGGGILSSQRTKKNRIGPSANYH